MKELIKKEIMFVLVLVSVIEIYCGGFFSNYRWGSRGSVLGAGFVALADDAGCLVYNSAGLGRLSNVEVMGAYAQPYSVVDFGMAFGSFVYPFGESKGTLGITFLNYSYGGLAAENVYMLGYGMKAMKDKELYVGATAKMLSLNILADIDTSLYDTSKTAFSLDVGGLYCISESIFLGLNLKNLVGANITLNKNAQEKEILGNEIMVGGSYRNRVSNGVLVVSVGVINSYDGFSYDIGGEYWMIRGENSLIGIRAGYCSSSISIGGSYKQDKFKVEIGYSISTVIRNSSGFNLGIAYTIK